MHLRPIVRTSLPASITAELRRQILSGALPAGAQLPAERELASGFAANRTTVREALRDLERSGLVARHQGRPYVVLDYRQHGALELIEPLMALGGHATAAADALHMLYTSAVDLVVARAADADLDALGTAIDPIAIAVARGDVAAVIEADRAFHRAFFALARSPFIELMLNGVSTALERATGSAGAFGSRTAAAYVTARYDETSLPHAGFVAALRARDRNRARAVVAHAVTTFTRVVAAQPQPRG